MNQGDEREPWGAESTGDIDGPPPDPLAGPPLPDVLQRAPQAGRPPGSQPSAFSDVSKAWSVALDFVFTVLGALLLGYFLDRWQGTNPRWTIVGLVVGFTFALYRIIRRTLADEKQEKAARERARRGGRMGA